MVKSHCSTCLLIRIPLAVACSRDDVGWYYVLSFSNTSLHCTTGLYVHHCKAREKNRLRLPTLVCVCLSFEEKVTPLLFVPILLGVPRRTMVRALTSLCSFRRKHKPHVPIDMSSMTSWKSLLSHHNPSAPPYAYSSTLYQVLVLDKEWPRKQIHVPVVHFVQAKTIPNSASREIGPCASKDHTTCGEKVLQGVGVKNSFVCLSVLPSTFHWPLRQTKVGFTPVK